MLAHLSLGTRDLTRAIVFYDAALAPLGIVRLWADAEAAGYGYPGGNDRLALKLRAEAHPPGPGFHLALQARSRGDVNAFFAAGLRAGGADHGKPGPRPHYGPQYYAAFVADPDGHHLEAVCQTAAPSE